MASKAPNMRDVARTTVRLGLEVLLEERRDLVAGRRVGLVTCATGVDRALVSTVERLRHAPAVHLTALFGPEHGLRGDAQDAVEIGTSTDALTGLPVYSLYGETYQPTPDMLRDVDVLIYDMQDGGVRFYTYIATLSHVMQAAARAGLPVLVLDRPAPLNGVTVEGPVLDPAYTSFVGPHPIPLRYGMTVGELARLFNDAFGIGCDLTVVPMAGWQRAMWYDETGLPFVPPSPNLPTLAALTVYPGACLIEGTNLSEGRGTTKPFEYLGAPWIDADALAGALNDLALPGVRFRPVYFTPTFSKHQGARCKGVHVFVTDRDRFRPIETALYLITAVKSMHPDAFAWLEPVRPGGHHFIDLLTGSDAVRTRLDAGAAIDEIVEGWQAGLRAFAPLRAAALIYPD